MFSHCVSPVYFLFEADAQKLRWWQETFQHGTPDSGVPLQHGKGERDGGKERVKIKEQSHWPANPSLRAHCGGKRSVTEQPDVRWGSWQPPGTGTQPCMVPVCLVASCQGRLPTVCDSCVVSGSLRFSSDCHFWPTCLCVMGRYREVWVLRTLFSTGSYFSVLCLPLYGFYNETRWKMVLLLSPETYWFYMWKY